METLMENRGSDSKKIGATCQVDAEFSDLPE